MRLQTKVLVLSAILLADLVFFLFFWTYLPEIFETVFQWLPWPDDVERGVAVISGLIVAVLTSTAIAYVLIRRLQELVKSGVGNGG